MTDHPQCVDRGELRSHAFEAFPSQVAVVDRDGVILDTNGCWKGYAVDNGVAIHPDMVGENYLDACDAAAGDGSATEAARGIRSIIEGERESFQFEYPCHSPDERRWFTMRARRLDDGSNGQVLVVHTDITDRREAELAVEERNDQLTLLTDVLSHDLRNPLSVARGRTELIRAECNSEHVDAVVGAHERIETMIDEILTLAREGDAATEPEFVPLADVAAECWRNVETDEASLSVQTDLTIRADRCQLQQLLENVFRNAVAHGSTSPPSHAQEDAAGRQPSGEPAVADAPADAVEQVGDAVTVRVGRTVDRPGIWVADEDPGYRRGSSRTCSNAATRLPRTGPATGSRSSPRSRMPTGGRWP